MDSTASFGYWLRRRRKALDLTQQELAERAGCTVAAIRKFEADERRPSKQLAERLAICLDLANEGRATFVQVARSNLAADRLALPVQPVPVGPSEAPRERHRLPAQTTALIGRAVEVLSVCALLHRADVRLVTLTGPGGIGKTRLARRVAEELFGDFADGVFVVFLARISDPHLVATTIAQTLDVRDIGSRSLTQRLCDYLCEKQALLLLDNFEQVAEAAPLIVELLAAAPRLKVVVTSRVVLHLSGEHEFAVPPLRLPDPRLPDLVALAQTEAVALFLTRAQARRPDFRLTHENASAVAAICRHLDGLPLAIELAAARSKLFSPQALLERLSSRLNFLTGGPRDAPRRQQTLRLTLDWSYQLLNTGEQTLFTRLGVFVWGCTLEAAEAVCNAEGDLPFAVVDGITELIDHSLLRVLDRPDGEPRFVMLETIREYALERLKAGAAGQELQQQHTMYYLALAETAKPPLQGPEKVDWLKRLEREHDNLRAALQRALDQNAAELAMRLSGALWEFWEMRGHLSEGRRWLARTLAESAAVSPAVRATALHGAARLASEQGDDGQALTLGAEALALFRASDDSRGSAWVLAHMGFSSLRRGGDIQATAQFTESLSLFRDLGDTHGIAVCLEGLGRIAQSQGQLQRAERLLAESLALCRDLGDKTRIAWVLNSLGAVAVDQGEFGRATVLFEESLTLFRELDHKLGISGRLNCLGEIALLQDNVEQATALIEEGLALARALADKAGIAWALYLLGRLANLQGDLGRATLLQEESLTIGREMGNPWDNARGLHRLGHTTLARGDWARAAALFAESLAIYQALGKTNFLAGSLTGFADVARAQGQPERAAKLLGAAHQLLAATGAQLHPFDQQDLDRALARVRSQLDAAGFAAAWAEGQAMTLDQAIAGALGTGRE